MSLYISFTCHGWIFENRNFNRLNLPIVNVIIAERLKCCGMEDRTVVAYVCRKTKKLICGMEGKNVVAYGRLPSPAHHCRVLNKWKSDIL